MAKTLQVLQNLQEQQKKERENIYRLHERNLESLNESLQILYKNRLNEIEKNINRRIDDSWKEQIEEWHKVMKIAIYTLLGAMLIVVITGIVVYWQRSELEEIYKNNYILPKQEWNYGQMNELEWYSRNKNKKGE